MSTYMSHMIAPAKEGLVFVTIPPQLFEPEEARAIAKQLVEAADISDPKTSVKPTLVKG